MELPQELTIHILSFLDENNMIALRQTSRAMNKIITENVCKKGYIHLLIAERRYISAFLLLGASAEARRYYPLRLYKTLKAACEISHCGLLRYILEKYSPQQHHNSITHCINVLFNRTITPRELSIMTLFMTYGYYDRRFTLDLAAKHNSTELALLVKIYENPITILTTAGRNKNIEIVRVLLRLCPKIQIDYWMFSLILRSSDDIALLLAPLLTPHACADVYETWKHEHQYTKKYEKFIHLIEPRARVFQEQVAAEALIKRNRERLYETIGDIICCRLMNVFGHNIIVLFSARARESCWQMAAEGFNLFSFIYEINGVTFTDTCNVDMPVPPQFREESATRRWTHTSHTWIRIQVCHIYGNVVRH